MRNACIEGPSAAARTPYTSSSMELKYQMIVIGDVTSLELVKTRMAKSVLVAGWGMRKAQLHYKGEDDGR